MHSNNLVSPKEGLGGQGIPQASVRPLVRPVIMAASKQDQLPANRMEDTKPPAESKRLSVFSDR